jgi:hypothetical protein
MKILQLKSLLKREDFNNAMGQESLTVLTNLKRKNQTKNQDQQVKCYCCK